MSQRKALGKGLDALLPLTARRDGSSLVQIPIERIRPNAYQPRVRFESDTLDALAASIRENGVLQPVVVRRSQQDGDYELIAGERRWRAAQRAGLGRVPALVQDVSDQGMVELALVENIQRADLSSIEEANAYQLLISEFKLTQEDIARRVARSRAAVANTLRLLKLPPRIQELVLSARISAGHARALLPLPQAAQLQLAQAIVAQDLSVRQTERRVQALLRPAAKSARRSVQQSDPNLRQAVDRLQDHCQTKVEVKYKGGTGAGSIRLHFHSQGELDRLLDLLLADPPE